jgi:hypothetical protein
MANGIRAVVGLGILMLAAPASRAEEVNIGHLEATDDSGIDWQHYSCQSKGNEMHCHIFQTLINREIEPQNRERQIKAKTDATTVDSFKSSMVEPCRNAAAIRAAVEASIVTGKNADGRLWTKQEVSDTRATLASLQATCKDTTPENIRRFFELDVDKSIRTCVIQNQHFEDTFSWNERMHEWESRSKETGLCGSVIETRLKHDPTAPTLWLSEERHMYIKRNGVLADGRSCSIFPVDTTYHFTWRAANNAVECTYIKNNMVD